MIRTKSKINENLNPTDLYIIFNRGNWLAEMYTGKELQDILNDTSWENGEADPDEKIMWNQLSEIKRHGKVEELDNDVFGIKFKRP